MLELSSNSQRRIEILNPDVNSPVLEAPNYSLRELLEIPFLKYTPNYSVEELPLIHQRSSFSSLKSLGSSAAATMISDNTLYTLAIFLGSAAMILIVLYHFLEVNSEDHTALKAKSIPGAQQNSGKSKS